MKKYIFKRVLMLIPVILGITFLVFSIMALTPGDPAQLILGENAPKELIDELRDKMGLNRPFFIQYLTYISNILKGDFGVSYTTGRAVIDEIFLRFPNTLILALLGTIISIIIGVPLGIISAIKQHTLIDNVSMILALIGASMPVFWLGLMLILLFSVNLRWLPSGGFDSWQSIILPSMTLGVISAGVKARMTRSVMLEVISQDYIRTARAKGANQFRVIMKHALKNTMIPIVTIVGLQFGRLLGGAVLTETIYSWPGVGRLMVEAIRQKDTPTVLTSILFLAVAFSIVNLIVDIIYGYIDPRIKSQYK